MQMIFQRKIDKDIISKIEEIASNPYDPYFWEKYYEFVIASYLKQTNNRFSVSELFFKLKEYNLSQTRDMITVYAHGLYILAKHDKRKIYGDDFNV